MDGIALPAGKEAAAEHVFNIIESIIREWHDNLKERWILNRTPLGYSKED